MTDPVAPADVRTYWLETLEPKDWYTENAEVDQTIRDRFLAAWQIAHDGGCQNWLTNAQDTFSYIILTDQFPRNMFRGDARSFATDARALAATERAIAEGWDLEIPEPERQFVYVTLMHSENLETQARGIEMFSTRMPQHGDANINHAKAHHWVIETFGRFPYRNAALGRETTPEEQDFLDAGGYRVAIQKFQS